MDNQIVAEDVKHVYKGGTVALDDVNLEIGSGLFGLLGSNGAGKSTLMRIICTLLVPTQGKVTVNGLDVVKDRGAVRGLFGYLPQDFGAWQLQQVNEVLDTLALLSGMRDGEVRRNRIAEVLESVGLDKVAERKVKQLSGGMVRRLGVAQALIHNPRVLIMDEPTVGLDPEERLRFRQLMNDLGRDHVVLLSTHIVADLGAGCNDLALIDKGRVCFRGAPSTLIEQATDKVCEIAISEAAEPEMSSLMEVVARTPTDGEIVLRGVVRSGEMPDAAKPAGNITLEEAYLAFMVDLGRNIDELEMEDT